MHVITTKTIKASKCEGRKVEGIKDKESDGDIEERPHKERSSRSPLKSTRATLADCREPEAGGGDAADHDSLTRGTLNRTVTVSTVNGSWIRILEINSPLERVSKKASM
jgi:hypothetical protein